MNSNSMEMQPVPHQPPAGDEPSMYLQRPSTARSQDMTHILAHTFRHLFTRDAVTPDTVKYLDTSRVSANAYHEKYVESLKRIQEDRERSLAELAMLERHIMQAKARAMSAEERQLNKGNNAHSGFPDLGLPPARSQFRSCLDAALLKKHKLLTPEDYSTMEPPQVPPPAAANLPAHARDTESSNRRKDAQHGASTLAPPRGSLSSLHLASFCDTDRSSDDDMNAYQAGAEPMPHPAWRQQPDAETREAGRGELARQQAKVDFSRNPRALPASTSLVHGHQRRPKQVGIKAVPQKATCEKTPTAIFVPTPSPVTFTDYKVGQVYEMALELKNVTSVMRTVRVIPPKTAFFSVGLGQFPGEHGLVAPGMGCRYTIRFAPDSLGDYDDVLTVQTQASSPMVVQLQGRRPPPVLTLPEMIDVGQCLVGGVKVAQLRVRNEGSTGRFCLMPRELWPISNFRSLTTMGAVSVQPFEVRPPVFELSGGRSLTLEILFAPGTVGKYEELLAVVCDNCHMKQLTLRGEGQLVGVEVESMEGGFSLADPGELCDVTADHLIKFDTLNPFTYTEKDVMIKNKTNVELTYEWVVVMPHLKPEDPSAEVRPTSPRPRVRDPQAVFVVEPPAGQLQPSCSQRFTVSFAPPTEGQYHDVLHLVLRDIPKATNEEDDSPPGQATDSLLEDITGLQLEVKGQCEPFSVLVQPYAVHVAGHTLVETLVKRPFRMINTSIATVLFQWESHNSNYLLDVEPSVGEIDPDSEMDFELSISGSEPCNIDHTLLCYVQHSEQPITLNVQAQIKGPELTIEQADVNFGLVRMGDVARETISISNTCRVPTAWRIQEAATHAETSGGVMESEIEFEPKEGQLRPLECATVKVAFRPRHCRSLRTVFEVIGDGESTKSILVFGEVQNPEVCLLSCDLAMTEVYLDVPTTRQVSLLNQTLLEASFEWGQIQGPQAESCNIRIEPQSGILSPRQQLDVYLTFTSRVQGAVRGLLLPCHVVGMGKPLYLSLSADVKGLSVSYRTSTELEADQDSLFTGDVDLAEDLALDFGSDVALGTTPARYLYIKNHSAISASFSLAMKHFSTKPPTPPTAPAAGAAGKSNVRRPMLGKTSDRTDIRGKATDKARTDSPDRTPYQVKKLQRAILRDNRGAAFTVSPPCGTLQPFAVQRVEVQAYCDMWGEYQDALLCKVGEDEEVQVAVRLTARGCPLYFQMVSATPGKDVVLRLGTHVAGASAVTRQMRINNSSPCAVRLDWQVFNKDDSDQQLLDLVVCYGDPFPPKEAQETQHDHNESEEEEDSSRPATPMTARRPRLIKVTLREHGGTQSTKPYDLQPSQLIIPARGSNAVNVTLTPALTDDVTTDCLGYALGYMSLEPKESAVEGHLKRTEGYDVSPIRLDMTAQITPPRLIVGFAEEEGMRYRAAISTLLTPKGKLLNETLKTCSMTLANVLGAPLTFRLSTSAPFHVVGDPEASRPVLAGSPQTHWLSLTPGQSASVKVAFRITPSLLDDLESLDIDESDDAVDLDSTSVENLVDSRGSSRPQSLVDPEADDAETRGQSAASKRSNPTSATPTSLTTMAPSGGESRQSMIPDAVAADPAGGDPVCLERRGPERRIHFRQHLVVEFSTGSRQTVPLWATLITPSLALSRELLDFGTCLVGQQRELQLVLANPTSCDSHWTCYQVRRSEQCQADTFDVTPASGVLCAHVTMASESKALIRVFFTASHAEEYEAHYIFRGMLGETERHLVIKGVGSYDGKHEAVVNI